MLSLVWAPLCHSPRSVLSPAFNLKSKDAEVLPDIGNVFTSVLSCIIRHVNVHYGCVCVWESSVQLLYNYSVSVYKNLDPNVETDLLLRGKTECRSTTNMQEH